MVTHSSLLHANFNCCFLPINRVCGAEEASCHLLHTWINLVLWQTLLLFTKKSHKNQCKKNPPIYRKVSVGQWSYGRHHLYMQTEEAAFRCWHPGQNGIIRWIDWKGCDEYPSTASGQLCSQIRARGQNTYIWVYLKDGRQRNNFRPSEVWHIFYNKSPTSKQGCW